MDRLRKTGRVAGVLGVAFIACATATAQMVTYSAPTFDRWNYPFNSQSGAETEALVFGVLGSLGVGQFDDRDGQFLLTWATNGEFTPGLGAASYQVLAARVTASIDPRFAGAFALDPTPDSYRTYLDPLDPDYLPDGDAGRPVELFGTGFRNGFTASSFGEAGPFAFGDPTREGVRNAHALTRDGVDASNNIRDRFEAVSLATGQAGVAPGALVPAGPVTFDLPVSDPMVQAYLGAGLNQGALSFTVSGLFEGSFGGPAMYPVFATKESLIPGAAPAKLELSVRVVPAPSAAATMLMGLLMRRRRR